MATFYSHVGSSFKEILSASIGNGTDGSDCYDNGTEMNGDAQGKMNEHGVTAEISTKQGQNQEYYDIILNWKGTEALRGDNSCRVISAQPKIYTYRWAGAKYELAK